MEPVHWGRDDLACSRSICIRSPGRNGARPLGTGRPVTVATVPVALTGAAMEPVHWGRDDARILGRTIEVITLPQWSPSTGDGTTRSGEPV